MNQRLEADTNMGTWRETLAASITRPEDLAKHLDVDPEAIKDVVGEYPMRITPMWMKLIKEKCDAIWRQVVPEPEEMADESAYDPLHEDLDSPVPHLELIRIGSRVPGSLPDRVTPELCTMLQKYHPIYINLPFNHPDELVPE